MPVPFIAAAAVQTAIPFLKKHPWLVPVIIVVLIIPAFLLGGLIFGGIKTATNIVHSEQTTCSPQYKSLADFFNDDTIVSSFLHKPCDETTVNPVGDVEFSAEGWTHPISSDERVNVGGEYGPRPEVCARFHAATCVHQGVDITAKCATPIHAVQDGVVVKAALSGGLGYYTEIDHGGGVRSGYAHQPQGGQKVKVGDHVTSGQVIGIVGSTGNSEACHLHFQILLNGKLHNPRAFMKGVGIDLGPTSGTPNYSDN